MCTIDHVRRLALSLPEVTEEPHHELISFRVRGKIFATVPDDEHIRVMLAVDDIEAAVAYQPSIYHRFYWGKRLACLVVDLAAVNEATIRDLLVDAWLRAAPTALARAFLAM